MTLLQIRGDNATVCDLINGYAYAETGPCHKKVVSIMRALHVLWKRGFITPTTAAASFARHIYREHNKFADELAVNGSQGSGRNYCTGPQYAAKAQDYAAIIVYVDGVYDSNGAGCGWRIVATSKQTGEYSKAE